MKHHADLCDLEGKKDLKTLVFQLYNLARTIGKYAK